MNPESRRIGTTSSPICRGRPTPVLHPGTLQPVGPARSRAAVPDGADPAGGVGRARRSRSPSRSATSTGSGGRRRSIRARRLEQALDTPARIYYKYEGVSPAGSHKPNTAVAQAFYNKEAGRQAAHDRDRRRAVGFGARLRRRAASVSTCASSWCSVSLRPEAVSQALMETLGRAVRRQPEHRDQCRARDPRQEHPTRPGSLGIAISEAVEVAAQRRRHQILARQRAQPRAAAPDRHRPGGHGAARDGRRLPRHHRRLHRRRLATSPGIAFPFIGAAAARRSKAAASSRASRRPARA